MNFYFLSHSQGADLILSIRTLIYLPTGVLGTVWLTVNTQVVSWRQVGIWSTCPGMAWCWVWPSFLITLLHQAEWLSLYFQEKEPSALYVHVTLEHAADPDSLVT